MLKNTGNTDVRRGCEGSGRIREIAQIRGRWGEADYSVPSQLSLTGVNSVTFQ